MEMFVPFGAQFGVNRDVQGQRPKRYDPLSQKTQELGEDGVWRAADDGVGAAGACYCTSTGRYCSWQDYYETGPTGTGDLACGGYDWWDDCGDYNC